MLILEILKWIGLMLLVLLLTALILLLLVLFLPIKYYGEGTYNAEKQCAFLKARWFWGLVRVRAIFPEKPYLSVKILWIELMKPKTEDLEENTEETVQTQETEAVSHEFVAEAVTQTTETTSAGEDTTRKPEATEAQEKDVTEKEPFYQKWIGIKDKIQYYINVLTEQDTKDLLAHCKMRIIKILKSIRPRNIAFRGTVGFATPDTTGYLYGGYCMISSFLGKNVILVPDFEREIIDVSGSLKGHITIFVLAWNALRIYLDKRLMRLIAKLKRGGR